MYAVANYARVTSNADVRTPPSSGRELSPSGSCARLGYLVPEFPGQTHYFFWREIGQLQKLGIEVALISTRPPPDGVRSESLAKLTQGNVAYIWPIRFRDLSTIAAMLPRVSLKGLKRTAWLIATKENGGLRNRARLAMLAFLGLKLAAIAKHQAWSHVHVHSCADAANLALFAHLMFGLDYSLTLHNPIGVYGGNQPAKFGGARFAIFITDAIRDEALGHIGTCYPGQSFVVPMGVDTDQFRRRAPYDPPAPGQPIRLFCCARLNAAKGHAVLLKAVAELRCAGREVTLTLAGEDDDGGRGYRMELAALSEQLALGACVQFLGAIDEEQVRDELESCSMFVLASFEEPLGIAIMEAMSMELPVVSTAAGGVPLLIDSGIDGILVAPGSSTDLAQAIADIADNPERAKRLASSARARAEREFSAAHSARVIAAGLDMEAGVDEQAGASVLSD